jgi:hypothetical protein
MLACGLQDLPSAAEAATSLTLFGTTKVVPFQNAPSQPITRIFSVSFLSGIVLYRFLKPRLVITDGFLELSRAGGRPRAKRSGKAHQNLQVPWMQQTGQIAVNLHVECCTANPLASAFSS